MDAKKKIHIHLWAMQKVTCGLFSDAMAEMRNDSTSHEEKKLKMGIFQDVLRSKFNGVKKLYDQLIELIDDKETMVEVIRDGADFELYSYENLLLINDFINNRLENTKRIETSIKLGIMKRFNERSQGANMSELQKLQSTTNEDEKQKICEKRESSQGAHMSELQKLQPTAD